MRHPTSPLAFALACVLAACGTSDANDPPSQDDACTALANGLCNKENECVQLAVTISYGDLDACVRRNQANCKTILGLKGVNVTTQQVSDCGATVGALSCDQLIGASNHDLCPALAGTLADGTSCAEDTQCSSRYCKIADGKTCGACAEPVAAGSTCDTTDDCADGLTCAIAVCTKPGDEGASCEAASHPCKATLSCNHGTCGKPALAGGACSETTACDLASGSFCDPSTMVCATIAVVETGEPCGLINGAVTECKGGTCKAGANGVGTCVAYVTDGSACDNAKGLVCAAPARCVSGVCTLPGSCE